MKKIKEKMTVVSADGKVTFYLEKRSDVCLYDCLHLDVIDDVEELRLDIPGMTTLLLSEEHAFPSVRKIYIGKEIQNIMIYNKTFPNVREVESDSNVFCSGSMLVRNENFGMSKTLLNTFCLKSDETADLNGIADIVGSAFYGCECTKAINTEQVKHMSAYAFRDSAFADAKKNPPVDGLLMAGSIIIAADPQADKYVIPDFATLCNSLKFNLSATLVVENVTVSAHILYLSGKIEEVHGLPETVVINDSACIDELSILNIVNRPGNLRHIIFGEKNTEYVAIDDIVYTKDMKKLEPLITSAINNVADNLETEFSGLEYSVKTAPSVEDKLLRAEKRDTSGRFSPKRELANFKDMIRYTEICNHRDIASVTKDTIEFMKEQGYTLSGTKNYYTHPFGVTGYKGIHLNFISPYGQEIELQVHSKESFDAKQKGHELYEKIRAVSTLKRDKEAMKEEIKRIHGIVKNPPNIEAIHDYKMPQKEKEKLLSIGKEQTLIEYESKRTDSNSEAIRFSVYYGNQESPILEGYENRYPDNSVKHYHSIDTEKEHSAVITSVDKAGHEIAAHTTVAHPRELNEVARIADETVKKHEKWMETNFPDKTETNIELNNAEKITEAPSIAEAFDDYEL